MKLLPDGSFEEVTGAEPEVTIDDEEPFEAQPEYHVRDPAFATERDQLEPFTKRELPLTITFAVYNGPISTKPIPQNHKNTAYAIVKQAKILSGQVGTLFTSNCLKPASIQILFLQRSEFFRLSNRLQATPWMRC